jgi:dihydrofolate reductase
MDITLLLTIDESGTLGDGTSIPWDCEEIHKDMERLIKGNTIIMGRNAYNELKCFRKTRVASRILFSKSLTTRLKHTSYTTNVFTALTLAKRIDKPVYILGGNQTAISFLSEGVVTNMILYVVPGKHDGVKFMSVGPKSFATTKIEKRDGYVVKHFAAIPTSQLPITELPKMETPPCKKPSSKPRSELTTKEEAEVDGMLASVFSNGDYGMNDFGDDESVSKAVYDLANNVDGLYDIVGIYANNQKNITDKLNLLIKQDQQVIGAQISLQERVRSIENMMEEKKFPVVPVFTALSVIAIALGIVGIFV